MIPKGIKNLKVSTHLESEFLEFLFLIIAEPLFLRLEKKIRWMVLKSIINNHI